MRGSRRAGVDLPLPPLWNGLFRSVDDRGWWRFGNTVFTLRLLVRWRKHLTNITKMHTTVGGAVWQQHVLGCRRLCDIAQSVDAVDP